MRPVEQLRLADADVVRIDTIISLATGQGLIAEQTRWRRQRNRFWIAVLAGVLLLGLACWHALSLLGVTAH